MVRVGGFLKTQNRVRRQRARGRFISPYQVGGTIFGKSTMARYPLMHTSSRLLEPWRMAQRHDPIEWAKKMARQRHKMKGGTIFGKFTRRRQNPLGFPSTSTRINPEPWRVEQALRRMKGGTIFGKGDLRKVLWANQAKARKQKGGNVFSKLKKRIQIDFPHRPFPSAHPIHDWYRVRKGIKRGRR